MSSMVSAPSNVATPTLRFYLPEIDGLRACAATAVFAYHSGLLPVGWAGVWLFFVLSGFVITWMLLGGDWKLSSGSYLAFSRRRAARIWPLYVLFTFLGVAAELAAGRGSDIRATILTLLTFTYNFRAATETGFSVFHHVWTLSTEQQFYLFYPFIFEAARRLKNTSPIVALVALSLLLRVAEFLIVRHATLDPIEAGRIVFYWPFGHFDAFGLGALIAFRADMFRNPVLYKWAMGLAGAIALGIILLDVATNDSGRGEAYALVQPFIFPTKLPFRAAIPVTTYIVVSALAAALLVTAIGPESMARRVLRSPLLVRVGRISYGLYLWHMMVIAGALRLSGANIADAPLSLRVVLFIPCLALSIWIADLSYRLFESRFHRRTGAMRTP